MTATFELDGQEFIALNGGPHFKFTPAISLFVNCETQEEVDESVGEALRRRRGRTAAAGSRTSSACRGRSFPRSWASCCRTRTPRNQRVMQAMLQMDKIDIERLQRAYDTE